MWALFLDSLFVAARCQATVGLLTGTGAAAAAFGVLDTATVRGLSKFHLKFLNKCIILQLNQFYSVERLVLWSCVPIVAIMHLALGAALGWLGGRLLRSPRRELLVLTTTFGNCGALPFVLIIPIIRNWSVTRDAPDEALETGFGVIGLYLAAWFIIFFSWGKGYAARVGGTRVEQPHALNKHDSAAATSVESGGVPRELEHAMETPSISVAGLSSSVGAVPSSTAPRQPLPPLEAAPTLPARLSSYLLAAAYRIDAVLWCVLAALSMGCWESLRLALSARGSLGWLGDAWSSLGHAGIVLGTVILGAGLWTAYSEARRIRRARSGDGGFVHALCSSVRDGRVCCTDGGCCTDERRFLALACALRLLALPALCMPIQRLATRAGLLPNDPTLQMILAISAGVPSSQTLVMLLNANGAEASAAEASKVYVPMYLLSVLTVSLLIVVQCLLLG